MNARLAAVSPDLNPAAPAKIFLRLPLSLALIPAFESLRLQTIACGVTGATWHCNPLGNIKSSDSTTYSEVALGNVRIATRKPECR